jgi:biopolymer transport protein ExbB/TolQ
MNTFLQHVLVIPEDAGFGAWFAVWVIRSILILSVLLYARCFTLLLHLYQARRHMTREHEANPRGLEHLRILQDDLQDIFERQRVVIGAMIAAAPLLGLLGTVAGMINTFSFLASRVGQSAMDGLAQGISEALIATMAGLAVAIPGVLLLYVAYRQLQLGFNTFAQYEHQILEGR